MSEKCRVISGLVICLLITAVITIGLPTNYFMPVQRAQTELLHNFREPAFTQVTDVTLLPAEVDLEAQHNYSYDILRWHNHTINLQLRNVRSRWLTQHRPVLPEYIITYPAEEEVSM